MSVLQTLLARSTAKMAECVRDQGLWLGHRLFLIDGSSFSTPDVDDLREHFGQPASQAAGCGFPTAHWLALVHFGSGLFQKALAARVQTSDLSQAAKLHPELEAGDVLVGDRAFCSYAHIALLTLQGVHAVLRAHQQRNIDFTPGRPHAVPGRGRSDGKKDLPRSRWIENLGPEDQVVEWFRPMDVPCWISAEDFAALPATIRVRELRYAVARPGFRVKRVTIVATLLDADVYSAERLVDAYGVRWTIETCFNHLKTTMKMDVLRCQSVDGVMKELTMFLLVYNLVRMTMREAGRRQGVPASRISFVDALRWLATARPGDELPELIVNPCRPGRYEPRVKKRRRKYYDDMTKPRAELRQLLLAKDVGD